MGGNPLDWDEIEKEIAEKNRREFDKYNESAKRKADAERKRHIELGWYDEDGNSLLPEEDDDETDDDGDVAR